MELVALKIGDENSADEVTTAQERINNSVRSMISAMGAPYKKVPELTEADSKTDFFYTMAEGEIVQVTFTDQYTI